MARLTNADISAGSDCDAIDFNDRAGQIDHDRARYAAGMVNEDYDPMVRLTYRRLYDDLSRAVARFCESRELPVECHVDAL